MYELTKEGRRKVEDYIRELEIQRNEILNEGLDTADDTYLPTVEDIESDLNFIDIDIDVDGSGEYYNSWGITDNYDSNYPISLILGKDFRRIKV